MYDANDIQLPPHNEQAEASLVGAVFLDNRIMLEAGKIVTHQDFWRESHRVIWRAFEELHELDRTIDVVTVGDYLDDHGKLDKVGGANVLVRFSNDVPSTAGAKSWAETVREKALRRKVLAEAQDVARGIQSGELDADKATEMLGKTIQSVSTVSGQGEDPSIKSVAKRWFNRLEAIQSGELTPGFVTGIEPLDDLLCGNGPALQRYIGMAALPKMGKSKLAFSAVGELCERHGFAGDIWYTDGPDFHFVRENVSRKARVDVRKLEDTKLLTEAEWPRVIQHLGTVKDWDVNVHAEGTPHIRDIVLTTRARLAEADGKPFVLCVDYLQNCDAGHTGSSAERLNITDTSRALAALRTDYPNLLIIALMQFNREGGKREMPRYTDLYGASQIEKDVDHLFILHRPGELDEQATEQDKRKGILWHCLTKHGPTGQKAVHCELEYSSFSGVQRDPQYY